MATEICVPRLGWSMEEGTFAGWSKKPGEAIKSGDPIFALEGEKALEEVESLDAGILFVPADAPKTGDKVKVGQLLGYLLAAGEAAPAAANAQSVPNASGTTRSTPDAGRVERLVPEALEPPQGRPNAPGAARSTSEAASIETPVTPRARRAAERLGVELDSVRGTGRDGRIRERDILAAGQGAPSSKRLAPSATQPASVPITTMRRTIADRMMQSRSQTAPVTLTARIDATNFASLRRQFQTAAREGTAPTFTDIAAKLAALALLRHPVLASRWEGSSLVAPQSIDIGIAVETEDGLLVPVLRDVARRALSDLVQASRQLVADARSRRVKPDQLRGGVFTITNLGAFGIEAFTPIINYPETAILGLGTIRKEPAVLEDGHIGAREQMTLSLTFDHRVVDGAPAARFLQTLREGFENPSAWLVG